MFLKKSLMLLSLILCLFCSILSGCGRKVKEPGEVIDYLKGLKSYTAKVDISFKNDMQELKYEGRHFYQKGTGYRVEIGSDRVQIHKEDKIYVNDIKNNAKYELEKDFDKIYSLSFVGNYIKLLYTSDNAKYDQKELEGKKYQLVELQLPGNNRNLYRAVMYINLKGYVPEKLFIYDYKNREKVQITYSDFKINEELNKELFEVK